MMRSSRIFPGRHLAHRDHRRPLPGESVRAGADCGKRDGAGPGRLRQLEAVAVARRQQFVLVLHTAFPDRTDCVQHVPRGQVVSASHPRVPGRAPSDPAALFEESRPCAAMNGPVHACTAHQARIGGVDDAIHRESGDVADHDFDLRELASPPCQRSRRSRQGRSSAAGARRHGIHRVVRSDHQIPAKLGCAGHHQRREITVFVGLMRLLAAPTTDLPPTVPRQDAPACARA